jgi:RimJ/RimL family protein N-acetyltransferase
MPSKAVQAHYRAGQASAVDEPFVALNGHTIHTRLICPDDDDLLLDLFDHLSPETRWRRFHAHMENLDPARLLEAAKTLAAVDNRTQGGAVLALIPGTDGPGGETLIGVARIARLPDDPDAPEAEAAIVVRDDWQQQGIGTALLARLTLLAHEMGVHTLVATVQADNDKMLEVLRWLNLPIQEQISHGEMEIRMDISHLRETIGG